jgi:cytoplasmic iron level regulating protein YaaA (DUF328/UPF0246 family)
VLVLLPPSETKARATRGSATRLAELSFPELTATRAQVRAALVASSLAPDALNLLGVPPSLGAEVTANALVASAPSRPAREVYTGVLYDALAFAQLDAAARRRANARLLIVSALYGAVRPGDRIAAYRLSMAVNLPEVGPLARLWRPELARALPAAAGRGLIVDCRSSTYAAAWVPQGDLARRWVAVRVPGATHLAKHTRGLVARALCESAADPRRPSALAELLSDRFEVALHAPARPGRPWVLDALERESSPVEPGPG